MFLGSGGTTSIIVVVVVVGFCCVVVIIGLNDIVTGQYNFSPMMRGPINTCHIPISRPWWIFKFQSIHDMIGGMCPRRGRRLSFGG